MCDSIHFNFTKVYALKSYVGHCALIYQNIGHKNLTFNTRPACRSPDSLAFTADHCS